MWRVVEHAGLVEETAEADKRRCPARPGPARGQSLRTPARPSSPAEARVSRAEPWPMPSGHATPVFASIPSSRASARQRASMCSIAETSSPRGSSDRHVSRAASRSVRTSSSAACRGSQTVRRPGTRPAVPATRGASASTTTPSVPSAPMKRSMKSMPGRSEVACRPLGNLGHAVVRHRHADGAAATPRPRTIRRRARAPRRVRCRGRRRTPGLRSGVHPVARRAVLEGGRPCRVRRDGAADEGAGEGRRRRIVPASAARARVELRERDARPDADAVRSDLVDPVEPGSC